MTTEIPGQARNEEEEGSEGGAQEGTKKPAKSRLGLWPQQDLNLRPTDYESAALTAELWGQESCLGSDSFAYRVRTNLTL